MPPPKATASNHSSVRITSSRIISFSRYFNVIGNVLGTPGYHNPYESVAPTLASKDTSIYRLGDGGDVLVKTTLMRWGNYDSVTGISRFVATEVPASLSLYANPVPVDQILPASLYRSSKPSWWGTMPWPAIGPTSLVSRTGRARAAASAWRGRHCRWESPPGPSVFDSSHSHSCPSGEGCSQRPDRTEYRQRETARHWTDIPRRKWNDRGNRSFQTASESLHRRHGIPMFQGRCRRC